MKKGKFDWGLVRKIILDNYDILKGESMRDSYYMVRELLEPYRAKGKITPGEWQYFATDKQAYGTYRDDVWTSLEQQHGLTRPETKDIGIVYDRGEGYTIDRLESVWRQARGFIFVEKSGEAEKIKLLSEYGWVIVAGQGEPLRKVRDLIKKDGSKRPILVMHDCDRKGDEIFNAIAESTRRTKHLDISLGERAIDIGLTKKQVKTLKLPSELASRQDIKLGWKMRTELSALSVLKVRVGIENPTLAFLVAVMKARGIPLSPSSISKKDMLEGILGYLIKKSLDDLIDDIVSSTVKNIKGEAVTLQEMKVKQIKSDAIKKKLKRIAIKVAKNMKYNYERDYEKAISNSTTKEFLKKLKNC